MLRICLENSPGAIDGSRTRDIQDHNLALYQLSYDRRQGSAVYAERAAGVNALAAKRFESREIASSSTSNRLQKAKRA
jgi:hypothetical protein